jgi:medium-chain acyl-[acyl-carrier-protein] hydrolase
MDDFKIYSQEYRITSYDVDRNSNARLTSILNYLQNSAWLHYSSYEKIKGKILPENYGWLLSRIRIKIDALPLWGDNIIVKTWSPGISRMFALRDFLVLDKKEIPVVKASTAWLIVDINKQMPVRPDFFKDKWNFNREDPFIDTSKKINCSDKPDIKGTVKAAYSDIDVNEHVNNAKYVEWMIDCYESSFINEHIPDYAEIDFTGQAVIDDSAEIGLKQINGEGLTYFTNAVLSESKKELCRMIIKWKKK